MTTENVLTELMRVSSFSNRSIDEIVKDKENGVPLDFKFVPLETLTRFIDNIRAREEQEKRDDELKKPIKKFLFVEDGSVDCDELTETLSVKNPEIEVVVYRQGAREPQLKEVAD